MEDQRLRRQMDNEKEINLKKIKTKISYLFIAYITIAIQPGT